MLKQIINKNNAHDKFTTYHLSFPQPLQPPFNATEDTIKREGREKPFF